MGIDRKVELNLDGTWTDITAYVHERTPLGITRGRSDETTSARPAECSFEVNNRDGRFSPRNPEGAYYGLIGRNTPVRVSTLLGAVRLVSLTNSDRATAPDSAGLSITGDIDLRVDADIDDWSRGDQMITKFSTSNLSYILDTLSDGSLNLFWSVDGTAILSAASTVPLPRTTGRQTVRATLDVNNGAGGRDITFYTGDSIDGPWYQLGEVVTQAGTTSIFDGTADVATPLTTNAYTYAIKILEGIGGTERANPDFTAATEGASTYDDPAGNTWTVQNGAMFTARRYRFTGEVAEWPVGWDPSGNDVWTTIRAAGVSRRLGQGSSPTIAAVGRAMLAEDPLAYWPLTDGEAATSGASGLQDGTPMTVVGTPGWADSAPFRVSGPLVKLDGARLTGTPTPYTATGTTQAWFFMSVPDTGDVDDGTLISLNTTGTANRWEIRYDTGGVLTARAFRADTGANVLDSGAAFQVDGKLLLCVFELVQNGANVDWKILTIGTETGDGLQWTGTLNSYTVGAVSSYAINGNSLLVDTIVGHAALFDSIQDGLDDGVIGYLGETAGRRIERLCDEEGLTFVAVGDPDLGTLMGAQVPSTLLEIFADCETTDGGWLAEPRDRIGIQYRTRRASYDQTTTTVAYTDLVSLTPTDDDQSTRNDVTADRPGGSSARVVEQTGPLSVQPPPDGVGRYDVNVPTNTSTDTVLFDHASWRVHLGTVDEARFPVVGFRLTPNSTVLNILDLDIGDQLVVTDLPAWVPGDTARLIVQGYTETLGHATHDIQFVCSPASPYDTALWDDPAEEDRYGTGGCELAEDLDATETSVDVLTTVEPVWTQDSGHYPFNIIIGGELMTATAISGTGTSQTFTVTRSVNGVVKTHSTGDPVQIADLRYYGL